MKQFLIPVVLAAYLFACPSCRERTITVMCDTVSMGIVGIGFDTSGYENATLIRYKQNTAFNEVLDSTVLNMYHEGNDTSIIVGSVVQVQLAHGARSPFPEDCIIPGYDYKIRFPVSGKTYEVTNVTLNDHKEQVFTYKAGPTRQPHKCCNSVMSCTINGNAYAAIPWTDSMRVVYLQK